jgi:hypothetical protein
MPDAVPEARPGRGSRASGLPSLGTSRRLARRCACGCGRRQHPLGQDSTVVVADLGDASPLMQASLRSTLLHATVATMDAPAVLRTLHTHPRCLPMLCLPGTVDNPHARSAPTMLRRRQQPGHDHSHRCPLLSQKQGLRGGHCGSPHRSHRRRESGWPVTIRGAGNRASG